MAVCIFLLAGLNMKAQAQTEYEEGQMAINAGITYGFDIEEIGLRAGLTYFLNPQMRVGGDITYWLPDSPSGVTLTFLEINGNFNYIFYNENDLMIYGIGTLGIHYARSKFEFMGESESDSDTDLALGLGIGLEYNVGSFGLFSEPKIMLSGFDQAKFNIGARIYL